MYEPFPDDNTETDRTFLSGEDPVERHDASDTKPIRILHDFVIFDPFNDLELVPLDFLDDASESRRGFEAAGFVAPLFLDDDDDDDGDSDEDDVEELPRLHTSAIWRYSIDHTTPDEYVQHVACCVCSWLTVPPQSLVY